MSQFRSRPELERRRSVVSTSTSGHNPSTALDDLCDGETYVTRSVTRRRASSVPVAPRSQTQGEGARRIKEYLDCVMLSPSKSLKRNHPLTGDVDPPRKKLRSAAINSYNTPRADSSPPRASSYRQKAGLLTPSSSTDKLRSVVGSSKTKPKPKSASKDAQNDMRVVKRLPRRRNTTTTKTSEGKQKAHDDGFSTSHVDEDIDMDTNGDMDLDLLPDFQMLDISDAAAAIGSPAYLLGADKAYLSSDAAAIIQGMKHALRLETAARRKAEERLLEETRRRTEAERQVEKLREQFRDSEKGKETERRLFRVPSQVSTEANTVVGQNGGEDGLSLGSARLARDSEGPSGS